MSYTKLLETKLRGEPVSAWISSNLDDPAWDLFLLETPLGEFQQANFWARYKQIDGWESVRVVVYKEKKIIAGFQILWRRTRVGRIGYVSRGPVTAPEDPEIATLLVELIVEAARRFNLVAIVVQPPAQSRVISSCLAAQRFVPNHFLGVVTATLIFDLSKGMEEVEAKMSKTTRKHLRQGRRHGVNVREGSENDLGTFFHLMLESCKRQGVSPNPSSESELLKLWAVSQSAGRCRVTFAEHNGKPIAGQFCIAFDDVLTFWRKGSLPEHLHLHPMEVLYHEALSWAHLHGFALCDFDNLNRQIAETLVAGLPLSDEQKTSRDIFNLGFGGRPVLLPEAYMLVINPVFHWIFCELIKSRNVLRLLNILRSLRRKGQRLRFNLI